MHTNGTPSDPYPIAARSDNVLEPWDFIVPETYEDRDDLWELGDKLFEIPVHPLPCPGPTSGDWHESLTVSKYDFFETWEDYLDVVMCHGELLKSEFEYVFNSDKVIGDPSWTGYGATIVTELPGTWNYPPMLLETNIFANGRVYSEVFDEHDREFVLG